MLLWLYRLFQFKSAQQRQREVRDKLKTEAAMGRAVANSKRDYFLERDPEEHREGPAAKKVTPPLSRIRPPIQFPPVLSSDTNKQGATRDRGRVELICGCMFAGKTKRLIAKLEEARRAGLRVVAVKHRIDYRYSKVELVTHDGLHFPAIAAPDAAALGELAGDADVVGVDEGQFFGRAFFEVCKALVAAGKRVIVAGIDNDSWGRPFPPFPQLRPIADEVETLCVPCTKCGRPAPYTQRMVPVTDEFMIGGVGQYEPRCKDCFEPLPGTPPVY